MWRASISFLRGPAACGTGWLTDWLTDRRTGAGWQAGKNINIQQGLVLFFSISILFCLRSFYFNKSNFVTHFVHHDPLDPSGLQRICFSDWNIPVALFVCETWWTWSFVRSLDGGGDRRRSVATCGDLMRAAQLTTILKKIALWSVCNNQNREREKCCRDVWPSTHSHQSSITVQSQNLSQI